MGPRHPLSLDTSPEAEGVYFDRLRAMSPGDRLRLAFDISRLADQLCLAGLRERHPRADDRELLLRLAALKLDRGTMIAACGWDPATRAS